MKKKLLTGIVLSLLLTTMSGLSPVSAAKESNNDVDVLPASIGIKYLDKILTQQEMDFESNVPLKNNSITKLTDSDETVLYYLAMTQVEGKPLKDFSYDISNVKVYKNSLNQVFVEGYIQRNFLYEGMPVETGFGDDIKLKIEDKSSKLSSNINILTLDVTINDDVNVLSLSSDKSGQITQSEFLENYRAEKNKIPGPVLSKLEEQNQVTEPDDSGFSLAATYTYNRTGAANYAYTYALNPNTNYPYFATQGDCTNFVSQALAFGGGIPQMGDWFMRKESNGLWNYTYAWINAGTFRDYIREPGGIIMSTVSDTYANAKLGDVYHYDTRNKFFLPFPDGIMEHAAIVTAKTGTQTLVSYHTTNRRNVLHSYYTSVEGGNRYLSHIH